MISLLVTTDGQPQMEMATIGREGVVGASEIFQTQGAMGLNLIQIPGAAVRIDAVAFRKLTSSRPADQAGDPSASVCAHAADPAWSRL